MKIIASSIAAHSNWFCFPEHHFLIDAGEGVGSSLGAGSLSSIRKVFITHSHWDHIAGLIQLINLRKRQKDLVPLEIYYVHESKRLSTIAEMMGVKFKKIKNGQRIQVGKNLYIEPFAVRHNDGKASGYKLFESRECLKKEFIGRESEIPALAREFLARGEKPDFSEKYTHHIFTHTGDTQPLSEKEIGHPEFLIHEATFPDNNTVEDHEHSTFEDAVNAFNKSGAKKLLLMHLSPRYLDLENFNFRPYMYVKPTLKPIAFDL